jgi:ABC-type hemin transport system substrate-binding protein
MSIQNEDQLLNADAVVANTRAGKEKNVWIVPSEMILRPTPRVIDALTFLHGELSDLAARPD